MFKKSLKKIAILFPFILLLHEMGQAQVNLTSVGIASNNPNPSLAKPGDVVSVSFTASGPITSPAVTIDGHSATVTQGSGNSYTGTYAMAALDPEGPVSFEVTFADQNGNPGTPATTTTDGSSVTYDRTAPGVTSINRHDPPGPVASAGPLVYRVTFSETVNNVDVGDFTLTATGTANGTIASVSASSLTVIDVTVNIVSGDGTLRLDLNASGTGIADDASNPISGGFISGETYTVSSADTENPSIPANLNAVYTGRTFVNLDWNNSTDNVGVTRYDVYKNNVFIGTVSHSDTSVGGLSAGTSYTFAVTARDAAGNTSAFSDPLVVSTKWNGLNYRFYQGDWTALPDFNALSPVQSSNTPNVNIGVRPPGVDDNFGFVWEGYIHIPVPGTYVFETISDDGSKFYFNNLYSNSNIALVNNDGLHGPVPVTGTINIPVAGLYPISITFFEKFSGQTMQVYWRGPGITRQLIPNSAFTGDPQPQIDNMTPSTPGNLHVVSSAGNSVSLDWDNSTDNVGVVAYDVYRNGALSYTTLQSDIQADGLTPNTSYQFTVKARDAAGNTSGFSNPVSGVTTNMTSGLVYRYYEGNWNVLPNFDTLTPVETGNTPNVDISVRPGGHDDNFGFVWEGYINIPSAGNYTFETISDDGSKFYFNNFYDPNADPTVDNDGLHPAISRTGTVNIPAAGLYPVAITFFEKGSGESMQVYWTGPGIPRQPIPNAAFTNNEPPPPASGLTYKYYEGDWDALPDFSTLSPVQTGTTPNVDIDVRPVGRIDQFAFVWEGYITLPTTGNYTFETISDDGSKLYFNSFYDPAATATVNNDGLHPAISRTGMVNGIDAGSYPVAITFFEKFGGEVMQVYWTGPGIPRQPIPNSAFTQDPPPIAGFDINRASQGSLARGAANANVGITRVYPNPFTERFNIEFYNNAGTNKINVSIYELEGRLIYTHHAGNLSAGNTTLKVNLGGRQLTGGIYMVRLEINGVPSKIVKLVKMK